MKILTVLNINNDSFSDGYPHYDACVNQIKLMLPYTDYFDIGAESTSPGKSLITADEELRRYQSIDINRLLNESMSTEMGISIDSRYIKNITYIDKFDIINCQDLSIPIIEYAASHKDKKIVLMHHLGLPTNPDIFISGDGEKAMSEIITWISKKIDECLKFGVDQGQIIIDPGVGFGKTREQDCYIVNNLQKMKDEIPGFSLMLAHSRKRFLKEYFGEKKYSEDKMEDLDIKTAKIAKNNFGIIDYVRVHNSKMVYNYIHDIGNSIVNLIP